jgi:hypothetical protein
LYYLVLGALVLICDMGCYSIHIDMGCYSII